MFASLSQNLLNPEMKHSVSLTEKDRVSLDFNMIEAQFKDLEHKLFNKA